MEKLQNRGECGKLIVKDGWLDVSVLPASGCSEWSATLRRTISLSTAEIARAV